MVTKEDIGSKIREIRNGKKLKLKHVAKRVKPKPISKDTLSRIERGTSNYTINMLFKIAEVLDCGIEDFCAPRNINQDGNMEIIQYLIEKMEEYKYLKKRK